jgi:transcriptional/translational regulatory protein YebC/TACO1
VDWIFEQRGIVEVELDGKDPDELTLSAIDAGAEDVDTPGPGDTILTVYTEPNQVEPVKKSLEDQGYAISRAESTLIPKTKIELNEKDSLQTLKLLDKIEDLDDVQAVHTNAEILDEYAEKYEG